VVPASTVRALRGLRRYPWLLALALIAIVGVTLWQARSDGRTARPAPPDARPPSAVRVDARPPRPDARSRTRPDARPRPDARAGALPDLDLSRVATEDERAEILPVVAAIDRGGPFPFRTDGAVFENRERRLPSQRKGYYREYTVDDADDDRGVRRIVAGARGELYYSPDHYRTFTLVRTAGRP
jgi:ribonuclease T1